MKMYLISPLLFFLVLLFGAGQVCGADPSMAGKLVAIDEGGRYQMMADNFFIIYDPSNNMAVPYKDTGLTRLEAEKQIIQQSNASLPGLGWQAGLYPHWKGGLWLPASPMAFKPYYELKRYDQTAYAQAIEQLPVRPTGPPMIQRGLMKLEHMLGLPGRTEVFIFSDGQHSTFEGLEPEPLEQARLVADKFDVCFTIVSSATTPEGIKLLDAIASVNTCSQVIDFDTVFEKPEHLFGKLYMDTGRAGFNNVLFDFDKFTIKPEFKPDLDKLGQFLLDHPKAYAVLSGFTDSTGTKEYNVKLSKKRADSVRNYLSRQFKINEERMLSYWYGFADPVASNDTEEGRALNRRVTIVIRSGK